MKTKLFLLLSIITIISSCVTQQYKPVEITEVVKIPSQSQKDIYNKTRQWFSQYFVSGKSVVDYENPETGTIIGNGIADIGSSGFGLIQHKIKFNIRIDIKEGKFRALTKITQHTNTDSTSTYSVTNISESRKADAEKHVNKIISDIRQYLMNKNLDKKSNW